MINFDEIVGANQTEHNKHWPYVPDHPCRILIVGGSGSGKTNALLNLLGHQEAGEIIDKVYLYVKDPYESKYQYLINKREKTGRKHLGDSRAFVEYSSNINDVYENIDDYNPNKDRKVVIIFDDMIAEKLPPKVTELFIRGRKLNLSIVFVTQSYFRTPKDIRLNCTHYFLMGIPNKRELQQICYNHSADTDFKDFQKMYRDATQQKYDYFVVDTTLPSEDPRRYRKNLIPESIARII